jgi:hypothetical protein
MHEEMLIDFYSGGKDIEGRTLEEIWSWDRRKLEDTHNYIQWLFPIEEPSNFNAESPTLTEKHIKVFTDKKKGRQLRENLITSLIAMARFYGFEWNPVLAKFYKGKNYEEIAKEWQTGMNHNFLRITRILRCLKLLNLVFSAHSFYNVLMECYQENPERFNEKTIEFWRKALEG